VGNKKADVKSTCNGRQINNDKAIQNNIVEINSGLVF
jgi:hypothetical protein